MRRFACALLFALAACAGDPAPSPTVDAGAPDIDAGAAQVDFMGECTSNEQCTTGLCFHYNMGPSLCTHSCTTDADCEPPSPGCSGMGVCKRPQ